MSLPLLPMIAVLARPLSMSRNIRCVFWNCRGLTNPKMLVTKLLAQNYNADLIILEETWHSQTTREIINRTLDISPYNCIVSSNRVQHWHGRQHHGLVLLAHQDFLTQNIITHSGEYYVAVELNGKIFAGVYLPPQLTSTQCSQILETIATKGDIHVITGDWNTRFGAFSNDVITRPVDRASNILNFFRTHHLSLTDLSQNPTNPRDKVLHTVIGPTTTKIEVKQLPTPRNHGVVLSDHPPIVFHVRSILLNEINEENRPNDVDPRDAQIYIKFLDNPSIQDIISNTLEVCWELLPHIDNVGKELKDCAWTDPQQFHEVAQVFVEYFNGSISDTIWTVASCVAGCYKVADVKRRSNNQTLDYLHKLGNSSAALRAYKLAMKAHGHIGHDVISRDPEITPAQDAAKFYQEVFGPRMNLLPLKNSTDPNTPERQAVIYTWLTEDNPIAKVLDKDTISKTLKNYPTAKARGPDGLAPIVLKRSNAKDQLSRIWTKLFNLCIATGQTPLSWNVAQMVTIPKDPTNSSTVNLRRPISLLNITRRIFEKSFVKKDFESDQPLGPQDNLIHQAQAGFRHHYSTLAHAIAINDQMQYGSKQVVLFDFKQAYDRVDVELLIQKLHKQNISHTYINLVRSLYTSCSAYVVVNGERSAIFKKSSGLMQGGLWSTTLFNLFINDIPDRIPVIESDLASPIKLFADDTAIIRYGTTVSKQLREDVQAICAWTNDNHMTLNANKSVVINNGVEINPPIVTLSGEMIPIKNHTKYLGFPFTKNGIDAVQHLENQLVKANGAFNQILLFSYNWPHGLRLSIYKAFIRSLWEYGAPIIMTLFRRAPTDQFQNAFQRLEDLNSKCIAWILQRPITSPVNVVMRGLLGLQTVQERFESLQVMVGPHMESITAEHTDLAVLFDKMRIRIPQRTRAVLFSLRNITGYRSYLSSVTRWNDGQDWSINGKIISRRPPDNPNGTRPPAPTLKRHVKILQREDYRQRSKMLTLVFDSARNINGLGCAAFFQCTNSAIRHYAIQWSLNNFGHQYRCPGNNHHFTRSCIGDLFREDVIDGCGLLEEWNGLTPLMQTKWVRNRRWYKKHFIRPHCANEYTILDDLLNQKEFLAFGEAIAHLLQCLDQTGVKARNLKNAIHKFQVDGGQQVLVAVQQQPDRFGLVEQDMQQDQIGIG